MKVIEPAFILWVVLALGLLRGRTVLSQTDLSTVAENTECVRRLTDLENSVLGSDDNIENLTKAFIPPNQPAPFVVRACYYVISENSTLKSENLREDCQNATYIFRWSTTPIFQYAPVATLRALTINLAQITEQTAILKLTAPVCNIQLLNYFSTLVSEFSMYALNIWLAET